MWTWSEAPIKLAGAILGTSVAGITALYNGALFIDTRYAHQSEFAVLVMMADEDRTNDALRQLQARIWRLEEHYGLDHTIWPDAAKEEVRYLEERKKKLEKHLNMLDEQLMQRETPSYRRELKEDK